MTGTRYAPFGSVTSTAGIALALLLGLAHGPLSAQVDEVDLVLQTERTELYEEYLDAKTAELSAQLDAEDGADEARVSLILVKLARVQVEADRTVERVGDAAADIDDRLEELRELIGDEISEDEPADLAELLRSIRDTFVDDPEFEAEVEEITDQIDADNEEIELAFDDFGGVLEEEAGDISDLAEEVLDSEEDFSVSFRIEGQAMREDVVTTITRTDLEDLEAAFEDGEPAGTALADAIAGVVSAAEDWGEAIDLLDFAESTEDNQAAIDATRSALANLDAALLALEGVFDGGPLDVSVDTEVIRNLIGEVDDLLAGETFAIGDRSVRPVALIESRTFAAYLNDEFLQGAVLLAVMARGEVLDAQDHDQQVGTTGIAALDLHYRLRADKARTRGWTWVLLAASAVGLSDPADGLFLEFWSSASPAEETFRGYFPDGMSRSMLEVLGVDLVVNTNATRSQMDEHMAGMRSRYEAAATSLEAVLDPSGVVVDTVGSLEAHAGLALVRTYFLVADNHRDVLDVVEMTVEGDIAGIVERFDTEDFDYSASLDSTEEDLDLAREDHDLVFLVLDKLDDDDDLFGIDAHDSVVPLPLTGEVFDVGLGIVGSMARTATAMARLGEEALNRAQESVELDLDPNELDFTDAEEPLDFALALERSNPDFMAITEEGADDLVEMGDLIEDGLVEFADAVTEFRNLAVDLEEEQGAEPGGLADFAEGLDDFYQEMREDFEDEEATTEIDGEDVDLSAWFDNPPEQLLQSFIGYLDDDEETDNTLAGLLPAKVESVVLEDRSEAVPEELALQQNYPNPFNSGTVIEFSLPHADDIDLRLYNLAGQEVLRLATGARVAGAYRLLWDGTDAQDRPLASGVYLYRLETGDRTLTRSLLLLR